MGLDITAYEKVRFVREIIGDDDDGDGSSEVVRLTMNTECPDLGDGLRDGIYKTEGAKLGFRAGSYSGYNHWRETLCKVMLDVPPDLVWDDPEAYAGKPFVELINFSDCEGFMGPKTCAKLATDFEANRAKAHAVDDAWFIARYDEWAKAFALAAGEGVVDFH